MKRIFLLLAAGTIGLGCSAFANNLPLFCANASSNVVISDDNGPQVFYFFNNNNLLYQGNVEDNGSSHSFACPNIAGFSTMNIAGYPLEYNQLKGTYRWSHVYISLATQSDSDNKTPEQLCAENIQKAGGGYKVDTNVYNTQGQMTCYTITGY